MNQSYDTARPRHSRRSALAVALAMGLCITGVAHGQATTGTIFGSAPAEPGATVTVTNTSGTVRTVAVDAGGRYNINHLPVGSYTVVLQKGGQTLDTRANVGINAGGGTEVDFAATGAQNAQNLAAVQVSASSIPAIDVTSVNSSIIITAQDLQRLPVERSAESIALLSPGTVPGSGFFANMGAGVMMGGAKSSSNPVSFGGSSVTENSYYINGYSTSAPYRNIGGFQLPYGAIDQQQTFTGGYSAQYGRSDGGVLNQIGKRGTNRWHFGAQISWSPRFLQSSADNVYYGNVALPDPVGGQPFKLANPDLPGTMFQYRNDNTSWQTIYSAYIGGPLIKDKLYVFVAAETSKDKGTFVDNATVGRVSYFGNHSSRYYGKLDWNVDDNNVVELTLLRSEQKSGTGSTYNFDYDTLKSADFVTSNDRAENNARFVIGKYTSYISDNATLSVLYGMGKFDNPITYGNLSQLPFISRAYNQNPALLPTGTGPQGIANGQTNTAVFSKDATNSTHGLRADFTYQVGNHLLGIGIDNMVYGARNQGQAPSGPGYSWRYLQNVKDTQGVNHPYAVEKREITFLTSMTMNQKAYYLQDVWNVTDTLQLNVGLRNDHFTNNNDLGVAFVDEKNQWEPRLGLSWDVNGDSTLKVYGNAGRYYLALPNNASERAANRSTFLTTEYSYTGIDANGIPTGLVEIVPVHSPDGEDGKPKDPRQVSAANLRAQYQDEYILGFDKTLGTHWVYGAKLTYRDLKTAIDDECSPERIANKMTTMGLDPGEYQDSLYGAAYCRLINPGLSNDMLIQKDDGSYTTVTMTQQDWGYKDKAKRTYAGLDLYLEHPFDGKWQARIDYTYARARGNTEGQVRTDFGQADVSKTEDWDSWELMEGQDGELMNQRKHSLRMRGAWQFTPEWLVSATVLMQSGMPQECLGYYGPDASGDPTGYNNNGSGNYHWCAGQIVRPGSDSPYAGHTPWTHQLNLGVHYTPAFAHHRLAFKLNVYNALNEQRAMQTNPTFAAGDHVVSNTFHQGVFFEPPRFVRLSVSYDY